MFHGETYQTKGELIMDIYSNKNYKELLEQCDGNLWINCPSEEQEPYFDGYSEVIDCEARTLDMDGKEIFFEVAISTKILADIINGDI